MNREQLHRSRAFIAALFAEKRTFQRTGIRCRRKIIISTPLGADPFAGNLLCPINGQCEVPDLR
jgi:hypothetical protein